MLADAPVSIHQDQWRHYVDVLFCGAFLDCPVDVDEIEYANLGIEWWMEWQIMRYDSGG